jgi:hypothetical protein
MTTEKWMQLKPGQLIVVKDGDIVYGGDTEGDTVNQSG